MTPTPFPEPTARGEFPVGGGESRAFARWEVAKPKGRFLISHGYGEHGERYAHSAAWLNGLGWSVSTMDHRGFGRSPGIRGDAQGVTPFIDDLTRFVEAEARPGLPLVLLGHSFGGLLALAVALERPELLQGLVLSSPALVLRPYPRSVRLLRWLLLRLAPHLSLDLPNNKDLVCSDPELVRRYWADPRCHRRVTAAYTEVFPQGHAWLQARMAGLATPTLLLEAGEDSVADPDAAAPLWAAVRTEVLERHRLAGFRHEIFHDLRRPEAERLVEAWLRRLPAGNPGAPSLMRG